MDKLEKFLKENASKKPLIINETMLMNYKLEKDFKELESQLEKLSKENKIRVRHETFPPTLPGKQIIVEWTGK